MTETYLTTRQLAERLGVKETTVEGWRYAATNKGPAYVRIGGAIRYPESALVAWLASQTVKGAA